jgi:hypothetical protein
MLAVKAELAEATRAGDIMGAGEMRAQAQRIVSGALPGPGRGRDRQDARTGQAELPKRSARATWSRPARVAQG